MSVVLSVIRSSGNCAVSCDAVQKASAIEVMATIIGCVELTGGGQLAGECWNGGFLRDLLNETGGVTRGCHIKARKTGKPTVGRDGKSFMCVARTRMAVISVFGLMIYERRRYRRVPCLPWFLWMKRC